MDVFDAVLIAATKAGDEGKVQEMILKGKKLNINAFDEEFHNTALHYSCKRGHVGITKRLLAHPNIDPNLGARQGYTPLFLACQESHKEIVAELLLHPLVDVNKPGPLGTTPLAIACAQGNEEIVTMVIQQIRRVMALEEAKDVVEKEGEALGGVNARNSNGATAVFMACQIGHLGIVRKLVAFEQLNYWQAKNDGTSPLYIACERGHSEIVKLLLQLPRINVNQVKDGGFSPLYVACQEGHAAVVALLLDDPRVDVNLSNSVGSSPLCVACYARKVAVVKLLLADERVNINQKKLDGSTPLWMAAERGAKDVVQWMLGSGRKVDPLIKSNPGTESWCNKTAAERAKQGEYHAVAQMIDSYSVEPEKETARLRNLLGIEFAAIEKELEIPNLNFYQVKPFLFTSFEAIVKLSLSGLELKSLSKNIGKFTGLTELNLSDNLLVSLPTELLGLASLRKLLLNNNYFETSLFEIENLTPEQESALNGWDIDLKGTPFFVRQRTLIEEIFSIKLPETANCRFAPVLFIKPEDLIGLNLSNAQISTISPRLLELSKLAELVLNDNPLTLESFKILSRFLTDQKSLKRLEIKNCGTTPEAASAIVRSLAMTDPNSDKSGLTKLEMDNVKLADAFDIDHIPFEVLQEGTHRIASFVTSLNRYPKTKSSYRTKLMVIGDEGCGKTALLDCLFPLSGDLEVSEGFVGYFLNTHYHYRLAGCRLQKFVSKDLPENTPPLEEIVLTRGEWTASPIEDWANYGFHLAENTGMFRQIYLYTDSAEVRDVWLARLQRVISYPPTVGINVLHHVVDHPVASEAAGDNQALEVTVLDFSGDRQLYFGGQQLFLQTRAVYLVVYDVSKAESGLQGLEFWLKALAARVPAELTVAGKTQEEEDASVGLPPVPKQNLYSVLVVGTHADDPSVPRDQLRARTERVKQVFDSLGLSHPVDYLEVSCVTGENVEALRSAMYFVPLTHTYMGERLPKIHRVIERALLDLRKMHASFPLLTVNRVVEHCHQSGTLDKAIVKVALKLLASSGRCIYFDGSEELSETVVLDPQFFLQDILFQLFSHQGQLKVTKGVLHHRDLQDLWPSLSAKKNFPELAQTLLRYLQALGLAYRDPTSPPTSDILAQRTIFPALLPQNPPAPLAQTTDLEDTENWWPKRLSPGLLELEQIFDFTLLTPEYASSLLIHLQQVINPKAIWRFGLYHEGPRTRALVRFEVAPSAHQRARLSPEVIEAQRAREFDRQTERLARLLALEDSDLEDGAEMNDHEGGESELQPLAPRVLEVQRFLYVKVRGYKRARCRAVMLAVMEKVHAAMKLFGGMKVAAKIPSPLSPTTLVDLQEAKAAKAQNKKMVDPSTGGELDPEELLVRAGLCDKAGEEEHFWWSWILDDHWGSPEVKEGKGFSRFLFIDDGRIRDKDAYEKLGQLIGPEELKSVKSAYAIHNQGLKAHFEAFHDQLKQKWEKSPATHKRDTWRRKPEPVKRQALLKRLDGIYQGAEGHWNEKGRIPSVPAICGVSERDVWSVCELGVGMLKDTQGCLGKGIYFTSSLGMASQRSGITQRGKLAIVGLATLGNAFPVIEHPFGSDESYLEKDCEVGFQAHYATGYPIVKEFHPLLDADQYVVFNPYQVLPLFVVFTA